MIRILGGVALAALFAGSASAQDLKFKPGEDARFNWKSYDDFAAAHKLEGQTLTIFGPWRGEDQALVESMLAYFTTATGINGGNPNPPAIAPASANSKIIVVGAGAIDSTTSGSTFSPPSDLTCSSTTGRVSKASTFAPRRFAVAMACNPATPAPMMKTFTGLIVPAGVIIIGKIFPDCPAATITAAYPARLACDDSTSIFCARVLRGTISRLIALTPRCASALMRSGD